MKEQRFEFSYEEYKGIEELQSDDATLLEQARAITANAYAPYSKFEVGAAARLANGEIVKGTNWENASYPVGSCAERTLLGAASTMFPNVAINTMAISYKAGNGKSDHPISPCGMCRQALSEFERKGGKPMRIILAGQEGEVFILQSAQYLLPLAFSSDELK